MDESSSDRLRCFFLTGRDFLIYLILYCVYTLQESLKSLTIVRAETKTDARVDGTIRDSHKEGDRMIEPKATRQVPRKE